MTHTLSIFNRLNNTLKLSLFVLAVRTIMFLVKPLSYRIDIDIEEQGISVKLTFINDSTEKSVNPETLNNLSDYLTLESIQSKSEVTEAIINELADEVDAAVWETLKSQYIKG